MRLKHPQVFLLIWGFLEGGGAGCVHPRTGTGSARRDRLENSLFCVITSGPCPPFHFLWNPPPSRSSELKEKKKIQNNKNEGPHLFQAAPLPAPTAVPGGAPSCPTAAARDALPTGRTEKAAQTGEGRCKRAASAVPQSGGLAGTGWDRLPRGSRGVRSSFPLGRRPTGASGGRGGKPTGSGGVLEPPAGAASIPLLRGTGGPAPRPGCGWPGVPRPPAPERGSSAALI